MGHLKTALVLLENGADPNLSECQFHRRTPLELTAVHGKLDMAQLLLSSGAVLSRSAVDIAEQHGHLVTADFLREEIRKRNHGDMDEGEEIGKDADQQVDYEDDSDITFVPTVELDFSEPRRILEEEDFDTEGNVDQHDWLFGLDKSDFTVIGATHMDEQDRVFGHEE